MGNQSVNKPGFRAGGGSDQKAQTGEFFGGDGTILYPEYGSGHMTLYVY